MEFNSYYLFNEKSGNVIFDYYNNNNLNNYNTENDLSSINDNTFLFKNNYFENILNKSYNDSFTIILQLNIIDINLYDENIDYYIFYSDSPKNKNIKSFGIILKKVNNKYYYQIKLYNYYNTTINLDICEINSSINNIDHHIIILWESNEMKLNTIFNSNNFNVKYQYSFDPNDLYFNGFLPNFEGIDIYNIELLSIVIGYGYSDNTEFKTFNSNIKLCKIHSTILSELEINNFIEYQKLTTNRFIGSNYFDNLTGFMLIDSTNSNNIIFNYNGTNSIPIDSNYGWKTFGHKNKNNSYLFSNDYSDYFYHITNLDFNISFSFSFWVKGDNIESGTFLSINIPKDNNIIKLNASIFKENDSYNYKININNEIIHNIGYVNEKLYKWDYICICFDNNQYNSEIKTYLNSNITNSTKHNLNLILNKNSEIILGINSEKNNKFNGYIGGLQIYDKFIDHNTVDYNFKKLDNCYHPNTNILTKDGYINITKLKRGDLIKTLTSYKKLARLIETPVKNKDNTYIIFKKGSIEPNIPNENLIITKGHPIYYKGEFYNPEDFANNIKFDVEFIKINIKKLYHLQFEEHHIIYSNNLLSTSLPPNTNYLNLYLPQELYFDKKKFKYDNIGKHYPPYFLHEDPIPLNKLEY